MDINRSINHFMESQQFIQADLSQGVKAAPIHYKFNSQRPPLTKLRHTATTG